MKNFKLGRGYIDNSIRRRYNINVGEINPNYVEEYISRIRNTFRMDTPMDYYRREMRHEYYRRILNLNNNQ